MIEVVGVADDPRSGTRGPSIPLPGLAKVPLMSHWSELLAIFRKRSFGGLGLVAGLVTVIVSCSGDPVSVASSATAGSVAPGSPTTAGSVARPSMTIATAGASVGPCQVTLGTKGVQPPAAVAPDPSVLPVPWVDQWYGNEAVWIRLPTDGVLPAASDPGTNTLSTKFPWWRVLAGQLTASARLLDGSDGQFQSNVGTVSEYGPTGFVSSILTFDHAGCWEITAFLSGHTLSFVTRVEARQL
jgi:hypothetical protein